MERIIIMQFFDFSVFTISITCQGVPKVIIQRTLKLMFLFISGTLKSSNLNSSCLLIYHLCFILILKQRDFNEDIMKDLPNCYPSYLSDILIFFVYFFSRALIYLCNLATQALILLQSMMY